MKKNYLAILLIVVFNLNVGTIFSQNWTLQSSSTTNRLNDVFAIDENIVIAVGNGGVIVKTTNSGLTWATVSSGITDNLEGVYFTSSTTGFAVGANGVILKTTNSGSSWISQSSNSTSYFYSVYFYDSNNGWVCGDNGVILRTINGGNTWTSSTVSGAFYFKDIFFTNSTTGWAVGSGNTGNVTFKTTNNGQTWLLVNSNDIGQTVEDIYFTDINNGYSVCPQGRIKKTTDGGTNWSDVFNEQALYAVCFPTANNGWVVGVNGIFKTTNAGSNWTEDLNGTGVENLYGLDFTSDGNTAWAVGNLGSIYKHSNSTLSLSNCTSTCAVRFLTPKDNSTNIPTMPHIVWQAVPSATSYVIELADNLGNKISGFNYPNTNDLIIATVNSPTTEFLTFSSFGSALSYNTAYKIKITAKQNTNEIACSIISFTTRQNFVCQGAAYNSLYQSGNNKCFGEPLSSFYNVIANFNGAFTWQSSNYCNYSNGMCTNYMCTEYTKRFYQNFWNINLANAGIFGNYSARNYGTGIQNHTESGLIYYADGGNTAPKKGDILVYSGATYPSHVSIISNVTTNDITIIQQNAYPVTETFSKNANNVNQADILGWARPAPININYASTTQRLTFSTQITGASFEIYLQKQDGTCYTPVTNYNPYAIPANTASQVVLQAGTYRAKVTAKLSNNIGSVNSDFYYFVLNAQTTVNIPANGSVTVNAVAINPKKSKSTPESAINVKISRFVDGEWYYNGYTNEVGTLFAEFVPSLTVGDIIKAEGAGYETKEITITQNMINEGNIPISLNQIITPDIVNPQIIIVDNQPIYTSNLANLKVKAKNHTKYILSNTVSDEIVAYTNEHLMADSIISINLYEGNNNIFVTYINDVDTVTLLKTINYQSTIQNSYSVTVFNGENVKMYLNGSFISILPSNMEMITLPLGSNQLVFEKEGYKTIYQTVDNTSDIMLNFEQVVTKIQEIEFEAIAKIFPNPSDGIFKIEFANNDFKNARIDIYDLSGKLILSEKNINSNTFDINLSNNQSGLFIVNLTIDNKQYKYKIMKK